MVTTKQADEIIDVIMDYVEVTGNNIEDAYPDISTSDRNKLISIIIDIIEGS